jgi:hypothetical protein
LNVLDASPLGKNVFIILAVIANHSSLDYGVYLVKIILLVIGQGKPLLSIGCRNMQMLRQHI